MLLLDSYCGDYVSRKLVCLSSAHSTPPAKAILPCRKYGLRKFFIDGGYYPEKDDDASDISSITVDPANGRPAAALISPPVRSPPVNSCLAAATTAADNLDSDDEDIYGPPAAPDPAAMAPAAPDPATIAPTAPAPGHPILATSPSTPPDSPFHTTAHSVEWTTEFPWEEEMNGLHDFREWFVKDPLRGNISTGSGTLHQRSFLDYFLLMYPSINMSLTITETNIQLRKHHHDEVSREELYKFYGLLLLITRCEFTKRSDLWAEDISYRKSKYLPTFAFGKRTKMTRNRFNQIWKCWRMSYQPEERPANMPWEDYNWMLVEDFTVHFNNHRASTYSPCTYICVDESITRWYGMGADYINIGHPHPLYLDRKPEGGGEIQSACCSDTGVMIRMRTVKSADYYQRHPVSPQEAALNNGTRVLKELTLPWQG
jgi:hypothetical protein